MSAAPFGASAPAKLDASRNAGSTAIASSIAVSTPGGTIQLAHVNTVTVQSWLGQSSAVISGYKVSASTDPAINNVDGVGHVLNLAASRNLLYTDYGTWTIDASTASAAPTYGGAYAGGKPGQVVTPTANVPKTGSATFNGGAAGFVSVASTASAAAGAGKVSPWSGAAQITANWATGAVTGSVTGIQAYALGGGGGAPIGTVNDIALSGTLSGSSLTGTTSASAIKGGAFDITGATGTVAGALFGPAAQEVAGSFILNGGVNGATVLGAFGASTANVAPCDRRLKAAIHPVGRRADGLKLYSWHYKGSGRRFVGPIAQDLLADPRFADAVLTGPDGFLWVDFAKLGTVSDEVPVMRREGEQAIARLLAAA